LLAETAYPPVPERGGPGDPIDPARSVEAFDAFATAVTG
jgi:hypothetical protein